jgi:hypothetical protein
MDTFNRAADPPRDGRRLPNCSVDFERSFERTCGNVCRGWTRAIILEISHRKAALANIDDEQEQEESRKYIDMLQAWLDSQRLEQLVSVNLGSWSGKSTRVMAEEAGCVDFYNYVYQPFSASVHSSWVHIGRFNMAHCQNPAHRAHGIPTIMDFDNDVYWLYLCAKYLQKTFALFDESTGVSIERERAFDLLLRMLDSSSES